MSSHENMTSHEAPLSVVLNHFRCALPLPTALSHSPAPSTTLHVTFPLPRAPYLSQLLSVTRNRSVSLVGL